MLVSAQSLQSFLALGLGFAVAGLSAAAFQLVTSRPATFDLLNHGPSARAFAAVPFLAFAAPFLILRLTLRAQRRQGRFQTVMLATIIACAWSLMSGTVVAMALRAIWL